MSDFFTVEELRKQVGLILKSPKSDIQLGYYEPGHGTIGKKRFLSDVIEMKQVHERKREVLLWCYDPCIPNPKASKRPHDGDSAGEPSTKQSAKSRFETALQKKMDKVEEVFDSLKKKHGSTYKVEQLRAWANMVQMEKHHSLDEPPAGRFFNTKAADKENRSGSEVQSAKLASDRETLSPAKRVSLRSQCIEQLEKRHRLMESGAISKEQYNELQSKLFNDITYRCMK